MPVWLVRILKYFYFEYPLDQYDGEVEKMGKLSFKNQGYQKLYEEILASKKITSIEYVWLNKKRIEDIEDELDKRKASKNDSKSNGGVNTHKHSGKISLIKDPNEIQKEMRKEWDHRGKEQKDD